MNKKASADIYLLLLVIITLICLSTLNYAIQKNNSEQRTEIVGRDSVTLIKLYDEAEKMKLYLHYSLQNARYDTLEKLKENGGYDEESKCPLSPLTGDNTNVLNKCPPLDIRESFKKQLRTEMQKYLKSYKSQYQKTETDSLLKLYESAEFEVSELYSGVLNNAKIKDIFIADKLILELEPLRLPLEYNTKSHYTIEPKISTDAPNLADFESIHLILTACKDIPSCQDSILQLFPDAEITTHANLMKINANGINLAIELP